MENIKLDTAGIIDYKYNAQGVAYVHEDESVKLGETVGWYAGLVHNRYKFEDIGRSKEGKCYKEKLECLNQFHSMITIA